MSVFKWGLALAAGVVALCPGVAAASGPDVSASADLGTSLRTCHTGVRIYTPAQSPLVNQVNTLSTVRTITDARCPFLSGVSNPRFAINVTTFEYPVDAAQRAVMTQTCFSNPDVVFYCSTDGSYNFALPGVKYEARAWFSIELPANETFTTVPPECTLSNPTVRHLVTCQLNVSLVTPGVTGG